MRILHIVGSISPAAGGPTEAIRMLVRYQPAGYSAEAVTINDPAEPFLKDFPFPVTAVGSSKPAWRVPALTEWLIANRHRFDGAIVHGLWEYTGIAARKALLGHIPYVVFPHGMLDPYFKRAFPKKHAKKWIFWQLFQRRILADATRVLFTTDEEELLARESFADWQWKPLIVSLGSEAPPADAATLREAFYAKWPALRDKRFLLFLGRIDPKKGPDLLLAAFASIAAQYPELDLVMAGPATDAYKLELESLIPQLKHRIHWPGMLLGEAKWGALAACEAFALTSHQENFGIAVVEALASGKPVLISDQINIAADIAADGCGLVEPDTLDGAKSLLRRWLALTPAQQTAMGEQARHTFAARYDMRKNTEVILNVFTPKESR